ncbi:hypothetical protein BDZ85DRAFT_7493 [Elsinoe ampelina]|uniref:DUF7371 domain-containing protein n=1 Tax=Elsinoe ampelina TaxID=302913 RepID=A0A6A6GPU6_9PEZI|nr:hypothetical protein BDZ85DRAFT_7493 [Elsinoe ampelina]
MKTITALLVAMAATIASAQDLSTCVVSVDILTVFDTITVTQTVAKVTTTVVSTEIVTITAGGSSSNNLTTTSTPASFTYLPTSSDNSNTTATIFTASTTSVFPTLTLTIPRTNSVSSLLGPGASGWNGSSSIISSLGLPTDGSNAELADSVSGIFGRDAQLEDVEVGEFTETELPGNTYPGPVRYSPGTIGRPGLSQSPPYPTTAVLTSLTAPVYATDTVGRTTCNQTISEPSTLSTRTIPFPSGTGLATVETDCGETGDFRFGWDDLPRFITNLTDITRAVPIFSPYRHFQFSEGYVYAPLPETPFRAVTPPHLAVFITKQTGAANIPSPGFVRPGELGAGARASNQVYWFNAYSAYLGCDNTDSPGCMYEISGYVYDRSFRDEVLAYQSNVTVPACPALEDCDLTFVDFPLDMRGLSGLQIRAFAGEEQRIWFMDELALGWWDNSCEAGQTRARGRNRSIET